MLHGYPELPVSVSVCRCKTVVLGLSSCDVSVIRRVFFVSEIIKNNVCGQIKKS